MRVTIEIDPQQQNGAMVTGAQQEMTAEDAGAVPSTLLAQIGEQDTASRAGVDPPGAGEDAGGPPAWLLAAVESAAPAETGEEGGAAPEF
jgi:hypothetical protein